MPFLCLSSSYLEMSWITFSVLSCFRLALSEMTEDVLISCSCITFLMFEKVNYSRPNSGVLY